MAFVREALYEALKLETALARIRSERRVVLMHYAPIQGTVEGEPLEIYPFLGSSRLEEPLTRYPVDAVLHGHAHHGQLEGRTHTGTPVYNVSLSLLQRCWPERAPYRILELPRTRPETLSGTDGSTRPPDEPPAGTPFPPGTPSSVMARRSSVSSSSRPCRSCLRVTSSFTVSPLATASFASLAASA